MFDRYDIIKKHCDFSVDNSHLSKLKKDNKAEIRKYKKDYPESEFILILEIDDHHGCCIPNILIEKLTGKDFKRLHLQTYVHDFMDEIIQEINDKITVENVYFGYVEGAICFYI